MAPLAYLAALVALTVVVSANNCTFIQGQDCTDVITPPGFIRNFSTGPAAELACCELCRANPECYTAVLVGAIDTRPSTLCLALVFLSFSLAVWVELECMCCVIPLKSVDRLNFTTFRLYFECSIHSVSIAWQATDQGGVCMLKPFGTKCTSGHDNRVGCSIGNPINNPLVPKWSPTYNMSKAFIIKQESQ